MLLTLYAASTGAAAYMEKYIDTHVHFNDEAFEGKPELPIARAQEAGVYKMILPDVDSRERDSMLALCQAYPGVLYSMRGLYPGSVDAGWEKEVELAFGAPGPAPVAVGEIGLDYHYSADTAEYQTAALEEQLRIAARLDLPVNIHLRDATEDFFRVLEKCRHLGLRGNMHAYSGSFETFGRLQKYGDWSIGVGGVVTFKKAGLAEVVKRVPLEKILLETDSPYLTPVPHRGERNESSYIPIIAARIAGLKGISVEEVAETTTENALKLFALN